jgi:hypothetical protein
MVLVMMITMILIMITFGDVDHSFLEVPLPDPAERSVWKRGDDGDGDGDDDGDNDDDDDGTDDPILWFIQ